ncbi:MAG: polyprenyl synthetase [Bacteroidetes bacterium]|nr:MAG: polyprenyl synthetase [Bacteroidota bacterium]
MRSFEELSKEFIAKFNGRHFPASPASLYEPAEYFLRLGGKRIRPVICLMGNELFDEIIQDTYSLAIAIELFHNFTLIHDDIMDKAPIRRGMATVHEKYNEPTALLSGDVMLVVAYNYINKIRSPQIHQVIHLFNKTAMQVCEGQQMDMDYEKISELSLSDYLQMIELKTSVLLAASLQMGAILGGAGEGNQKHLYEFGKNLGLAFQIQDDYLDAFGDPAKFGKQIGGDILSNKKTFLLVKAMETATSPQKKEMIELTRSNSPDKVKRMLSIFKACGVDEAAKILKEKYIESAYQHLEDILVLSKRKDPLKQLAQMLVHREY